jgi:hypothetical protein
MSAISYSQTGIDLLINLILGGQKTGFYVDVGCNDPSFISNSKFFYDLGWSGLCIDGLDKYEKFKQERPRDIFAKAIIGQSGCTDFYTFEADVMSTTKQKELNERFGHKVTKIENRMVMPLSVILSDLDVKQIDILFIDVEGDEIEVLQTHDWDIRPKVIVVEDYDFGNKCKDTELAGFLLEHGYELIADVLYDSIWVDKEIYKRWYK